MRISGLSRIRHGFNERLDRSSRCAKGLLNRVRGRVAVLLYHRIARHVPDPHSLCVARDHFAQHLAYLAKHHSVLSLDQLLAALRGGRLPRRAVAITFDDGYVDNLWHAKPVLEKHGCPATVFVVSGFVGQKGELLSDELERILLAAPELPRSLALTIAGQECSWQLAGEPSQRIAWTISQDLSPSSRHACFRGLHRQLLPLGHIERQQGLRCLAEWAGVGPSERNERRAMNAEELRELVKGGLLTVGAHTVHHLLLAARPIAEQRQEIFRCRSMLEEMLGLPVTTFAYPYGGPHAQTQNTVALVREAGFSLACANISGLVRPGSDRFMLPRYMIRDWPEKEFARNLECWFCD